ncbi:hypothetical protein BKA82DRAFT_4346825 [Pisolithus tinctorius]|nr:hypothetical protein BKA82DRAFT_4346825 [Pisolithus tinctorius]
MTELSNYGDVQMSTETPHAMHQTSAEQTLQVSNDHESDLTIHPGYGDVQMATEVPLILYQWSAQQAGQVSLLNDCNPCQAYGDIEMSSEAAHALYHASTQQAVQSVSFNAISDDIQNWFHHLEAMGGCKGLVTYQHVLAVLSGLQISPSASQEVVIHDFWTQSWSSLDP